MRQKHSKTNGMNFGRMNTLFSHLCFSCRDNFVGCLFVFSLLYLVETSKYVSREYCTMHTFNATCDQNEVILMQEALYGRMRLGRCVKQNLGYLGCKKDVIHYLDGKCSGLRKCVFTVPDPVLYKNNPCPGDTTPYLEAGYRCIKVETPDVMECQRKKTLKLTSNSGYIASIVTQELGIGSVLCPWSIRVQKGQQINITFYNFAANMALWDDSQETSSNICYEYVTLKEPGKRKRITTCGNVRDNKFYLTTSNFLEIEFVRPEILQTLGTFMIKYEVVGCEHLEIPKNAWMDLNKDVATIKCNTTDKTWSLTCRGNVWMGEKKGCPEKATDWELGALFGGNSSFPVGILIIVAIGVALGVFIGGLLLTLVIIYSKRKQKKLQHHQEPPTEHPLAGDYRYEESVLDPKYIDPKLHSSCWSQSEFLDPCSEDISGASTLPCRSKMRVEMPDISQNEGHYRETLPRGYGHATLPHKSHIYESPNFS